MEIKIRNNLKAESTRETCATAGVARATVRAHECVRASVSARRQMRLGGSSITSVL